MDFGFFPSIFEHPARIRFANQEKNEIIEVFLRQHWIVNVPWIIYSLIGFILPVIAIQLDVLIGSNVVFNVPWQILVSTLILWYMLIFVYVIENFLFWYYNIYIVTNLHVIDVDFYPVLFRDIKEISLADVQSVSAQMKGILGPLFNFGDVNITTASEGTKIDFLKVPRPDFVSDKVQDLRALVEKNHGGGI